MVQAPEARGAFELGIFGQFPVGRERFPPLASQTRLMGSACVFQILEWQTPNCSRTLIASPAINVQLLCTGGGTCALEKLPIVAQRYNNWNRFLPSRHLTSVSIEKGKHTTLYPEILRRLSERHTTVASSAFRARSDRPAKPEMLYGAPHGA